MSRLWKEGLEVLRGVSADDIYGHREQLLVAEALDILFESGHNIMRFYTLRDAMGRGEADALETLTILRGIVEREIELTEKMVPIAASDARLGYHSEAENYKFFPEKLTWRIGKLKELLETEFPCVLKRIEKGEIPFPYFLGEEEGIPHYQMGKGSIENAAWENMTDGESRFRVSYDAENLYIEVESTAKKGIMISPEFRLMRPAATMMIHPGGIKQHGWNNDLYYMNILHGRLDKIDKMWQVEAKPSDGTHFVVTLPRVEIGWEKDVPMKIRFGGTVRETQETLWVRETEPIKTLGKVDAAPGEYGWLMP